MFATVMHPWILRERIIECVMKIVVDIMTPPCRFISWRVAWKKSAGVLRKWKCTWIPGISYLPTVLTNVGTY